MTEMQLTDRCEVQFVLPSAILCFFHVYEEHVGTYGFRVSRHVLTPALKTGCDRSVDPHAYVTIGNDIAVDRTWCRACAAVVAAESKRGHTPSSEDHPSNKEIT
jgi:hypothetical protein